MTELKTCATCKRDFPANLIDRVEVTHPDRVPEQARDWPVGDCCPLCWKAYQDRCDEREQGRHIPGPIFAAKLRVAEKFLEDNPQ